MKLSKLMMAFAMCAVTLTGTAQTKVIAHRGYWKCEGSAQNSIASLTKAAEAKVYGSEFDVQLTKDKEIVVNHDDSIQGIFIILILIESYFTFIDIIHHFGLDEVSFHVYPEK